MVLSWSVWIFQPWSVIGHGALLTPSNWGNPNQEVKFPDSWSPRLPAQGACATDGGSCQYYVNWTKIPKDIKLTNAEPVWTLKAYDPSTTRVKIWYPSWGERDQQAEWRVPWMAPGAAPVGPGGCGYFGGNPFGCTQDPDQVCAQPKADGSPQDGCTDDCYAGGNAFGTDARDRFSDPNSGLAKGVVTTVWVAETVVEASWGIKAAHQGGYQYRLCKKTGTDPVAGRKTVDEDCFQKTPLKFAEPGFAEVEDLKGVRTKIPVVDLSVGTVPAGSVWRKVPIPGCMGNNDTTGGYWNTFYGCDTWFPPPVPGLYGFGQLVHQSSYRGPLDFAIWDKLQLPASADPGDYVLSWRWDTEAGAQIWLSCADIKIVAKEGTGDSEEESDGDMGQYEQESEPQSESEDESKDESDPEVESTPVDTSCNKNNYKNAICPPPLIYVGSRKHTFEDGSRTAVCDNMALKEGGWIYERNACRWFRESCCIDPSEQLLQKTDRTKFSKQITMSVDHSGNTEEIS